MPVTKTGTSPVVPKPATATPQPSGTPSVGVSSKYAREDHVHASPVVIVPTASNSTPLVESGSGTVGSSTQFARGDHVHPAAPSQAIPVGAPVTRAIALATAYQASTPAKAAAVSVEIECVTTVAVGAPQANTIELVIGATSAIATTGGARMDLFRQDLTVTLISLGVTGRAILHAMVPAGYYFAVRRPVGSGTSIIAAYDQVIG